MSLGTGHHREPERKSGKEGWETEVEKRAAREKLEGSRGVTFADRATSAPNSALSQLL